MRVVSPATGMRVLHQSHTHSQPHTAPRAGTGDVEAGARRPGVGMTRPRRNPFVLTSLLVFGAVLVVLRKYGRLWAVGTGGALAISALTSMTGFLVMAVAPMPMFQTFGILMAVMIVFALLVSMPMLPSLLLLVNPSRNGDECADLIERATDAELVYQPHAREPVSHPTR